MKTRYLLAYSIYPLQGFDSTGFEMTIRVVYLWGLFETVVKESYFIENHKSIKKHTEHWDNLIKTCKKL